MGGHGPGYGGTAAAADGRTDGTAETKLGTDLNSKEYGNGILNGMTHIHDSLDETQVDRPVSGMRLRVGKK